MIAGLNRRDFIKGTAGAGMGLLLGSRAVQGNEMDTEKKKRLEGIDCARDYPPDQYFENGPTIVAKTTAGIYREAEGKPGARFGYRFAVENAGKPHVAVIRYPDDKRRFMCIMDGTSYDLTTGVFTDWAQPVSGKTIELHHVFWPRWNDCSIVFMTWGEGEPAAVSEIEIWELESLPPLAVPCDLGNDSGREIGIQYEDPCGAGASEGALDREEWLERVVEYAKYTGQKLLVYPMAWYHGPLFPSTREPSGICDVVVAPDRKAYLRWTTQPGDWYARMLERFEREGLEFQGALTLMRLGSLMEKMNVDLESIKAGADTYNNMLWNDCVQESTRDWTPLYNVRNFFRLAESAKEKGAIEPYGGALGEFAYGERPNSAYHTGPMFNPLHPTVQEAILGFVGEIGDRYGKSPAFKGISFNMFASCMPWFGSIHAGYDDLSVRAFEEETEIEVPVDPKAPDRFSKRYAFLNFVCRPAWVDWRCRKIRELFGKIHSQLAGSRPDLRVTVTLWDETTVPSILGAVGAAQQIYARESMLEFYREAGIDVRLYRDGPGLDVDIGMGNARDRGGHGANPAGGVKLPVEAATLYRDFDFLDSEFLDAAGSLDRPGAFIFNCWVEAWGKHVWFPPEPHDKNVAEVSVMDGKPAEGVLRMNSEYPKDGFWWDSQSRITPAFPAGVHFLEPYAHAVAELDACRITRGGLFLDKAHSEEIQEFARAFRSLPREKFHTVGASTDPVAVRSLVHKGQGHFYAVNRDYYPIEVKLRCRGEVSGLKDLASGEPVDSSMFGKLLLGPYALRCLAMSPSAEVEGFEATLPPGILDELKRDAREAFGAFETVRAKGGSIPGMDPLEKRMRSALVEGRVAWLRRALTSYIVRKCRELAV